jgi:hypothetical protein
LEQEAVEHPRSGVQPEREGLEIRTSRSAALDQRWLLSRGGSRRSTRLAARRERFTSIRHRKRHEALSGDISLLNECLEERSFRMDHLADISPSLRTDDGLFMADIKYA